MLAATDNWRDQAICKDKPIEFFFPEMNDKRGQMESRAFCKTCPVKNECLEEAIENMERGIWGGTSFKDREAIRRTRGTYRSKNGRTGTTHGTLSGAKWHSTRHEPACVPCREAVNQSRRNQRADKKAKRGA
jgi:WhiB family redox-sensing transcriptional regulator